MLILCHNTDNTNKERIIVSPLSFFMLLEYVCLGQVCFIVIFDSFVCAGSIHKCACNFSKTGVHGGDFSTSD